MTTVTRAIGALPPQTCRGTGTGGSPLRELLHELARAFDSYVERRNRYAAMRQLRQMDDRTLSDIGVAPGGIPHAVIHGKDSEYRRERHVASALMHQ